MLACMVLAGITTAPRMAGRMKIRQITPQHTPQQMHRAAHESFYPVGQNANKLVEWGIWVANTLWRCTLRDIVSHMLHSYTRHNIA
jgi:hypothetical protein